MTEPEVMTVRRNCSYFIKRLSVVMFMLLFLSSSIAINASDQAELPRKGNYKAAESRDDSDMESASEADPDPSSGSTLWSNPETGYCVILEDDADLLNAEEENLLIAQMQGITSYGNAVFKSISYNNYSTSWFAEDYYHRLLGPESGTLFLIDMGNREIYIFSDGAVYRTITTSYANTITDNVYRYASDSDYYQCASRAFEQISTLLAGRRIAQPMKYISNALLALILAALINYFVVRLLSTTSKPDTREILNSIYARFTFSNVQKKLTSQSKVYHPRSSGSSGSHSGGGGGHSGGAGGHSSGGGHSGGGGGHRF